MSREPIVITEVLKDFVIAEEGKGVTLECKLNQILGGANIGHWYKDSNIVMDCNNKRIRIDGQWQVLEIKCLTQQDHGTYCYAVKTATGGVYTKCLLFIRRRAYDDVTRIFRNTFSQNFATQITFRNCTVNEKQTLELIAEFTTSVKTCIWLRNNCIIPARYPRTLLQEHECTKTKLYFDKTERSDTGIYVIVAKTFSQTYLCCFIDLLVSNDYTNTLFNNELIPHIWQGPNQVTEVYEGDDVMLTFKVSYDVHTSIEWTKNDRNVELTDRIRCETFCNRYIALKLFNVNIADSGKYTLILRNLLTPIVKISSSVLTVMDSQVPPPGRCTISKGLLPTVGSVGNGVTFSCAFEIPEIKYTYVVWTVGVHKIEKSNKAFKVICDTNEFLLHIPRLTPEMAGEVSCQLRQHIPPHQSRLISKTTSYLIILPPDVIEDEKVIRRLYAKQYFHSTPNLNLSLINQHYHRRPPSEWTDIVMHFQFCKINQNQFLFEATNDDDTNKVLTVKVEKKAESDPNVVYPSLGEWKISWIRPSNKDWYAIDIYKDNGQYCEVGISNSANLDIKEPPEDKVFKFRIRTLRPKKKRTNISFSFKAEEVSFRNTVMWKGILLPYIEYRKSFVTDLRIATGTFSYVNLVRRVQDGELFSAKTTKYVEQCKWREADREFDIMKYLIHPNTVALLEGFTRKNGNGLILTMEYLWGGELSHKTIDRDNLSEYDVVTYIRQILLALEYLHSNSIAHLDLKPDNIVCINRNSRIIKLIDFGMARFIHHSVPVLSTTDGSRDFIAPELINQEAMGPASDMWSIGVMTYWFLTGKVPFVGENWILRSFKITNVDYGFDDIDLRRISDHGKSFVSSLIRREPKERPSAVMALNDIWITKGPNVGRSRTVPVPGLGGIVFIYEKTEMQLKWKFLMLLVLTVIKFRTHKRPFEYTGRRYSIRLFSARVASRLKLAYPQV